MKRIWTESSAITFLSTRGVEFNTNKVFIALKGFRGLTSCSARDYLVNHCGYIGLQG